MRRKRRRMRRGQLPLLSCGWLASASCDCASRLWENEIANYDSEASGRSSEGGAPRERGLVQVAPSGSMLAALRLWIPSAEPTLEAECVLERTSRVIPAVGTRGGGGKRRSTVLVGVGVCACEAEEEREKGIWITAAKQLDSNWMLNFLFIGKTQKPPVSFSRLEERRRRRRRRSTLRPEDGEATVCFGLFSSSSSLPVYCAASAAFQEDLTKCKKHAKLFCRGGNQEQDCALRVVTCSVSAPPAAWPLSLQQVKWSISQSADCMQAERQFFIFFFVAGWGGGSVMDSRGGA